MNKSNLISYIQHTPHNFNSAIFSELVNNYVDSITQFYKNANLSKLADYLYSIEYQNIDYDAAEEYFKTMSPHMGGCSAAYRDGIFGRNYDWYYNDTVDFVVKTTAAEGRHASIGVAQKNGLNKALTESDKWNDFYSILPNLMLDGINDAGVTFSINVVPSDYGHTTGTNPGGRKICGLGLGRFILDNAASAEEAIELIKTLDVWMPNSATFNQECHFLIADSSNSYVVEFVNNKMKVLNSNILTNFYLYGTELNSDGSVYAPAVSDETHNAMITNKVTKYGQGLERFNLLNYGIEYVYEVEDMVDLMVSLNYTDAYDSEPDEYSWFTEFTGINGLTVANTMEEFAPTMEIAYQMYLNRNRLKPETWQTVHTSVYDTELKTLTVLCQELTDEYEFSLN